MTFSERMAAYLKHLSGPRSQRCPPREIPPVVQEIEAAKRDSEAGEQAVSWLEHPFTRAYLARLEEEGESAHRQLLAGDIDAPAYRAIHGALGGLLVLAHEKAKAGRDADEKLAAWRGDGTLAESDSYLAAGTA